MHIYDIYIHNIYIHSYIFIYIHIYISIGKYMEKLEPSCIVSINAKRASAMRNTVGVLETLNTKL